MGEPPQKKRKTDYAFKAQVDTSRQKDRDTFVDVKLSNNLDRKENFLNTSICHQLIQMIQETPVRGVRRNIGTNHEDEDPEVIVRKGFQFIRDLIGNNKLGHSMHQFATKK